MPSLAHSEFSLNETDGSLLEVYNEIEIKTEADDEAENLSVLNMSKSNAKKRPLNSNDMSNSSSSTSLTGIINNLNGNGSVKSSAQGQEDNLAAKKKRFKSQENSLGDGDASFSASSSNENRFKKNKINDGKDQGE
jgi:hypothetical protein